MCHSGKLKSSTALWPLGCCRRQQAKQFEGGVIGVFDDPVGLLPGPLGVEVLDEWELRPGDVLSFHQF